MGWSQEQISASAQEASMSTAGRLFGVFTSPRPTMEDIASRPSWVLPLILVTLMATLSGFFLRDLIVENAIQEMEKRQDMTAEKIEQARPMVETSVRIFSVVGPLVVTPIIYLAMAGVLLFTGNVVLGGEARFKNLFAVTCWSGIITILSTLINLPLMKSRGAMESSTSLAFLLPSEERQSALFFLLSQIDLFMFWWLAIVGIGFAAAYKFSSEKGIGTVAVLWVIYVAAGTGLKAIF